MIYKKINRTICYILVVVSVLIMLTIAASVAITNANTDTYENPYEIKTAEDLLWFSKKVNSGNNSVSGKLMNDINLNPGYTFTFEPDTGLVKVEKAGAGVMGYFGSGIKGVAGELDTFDSSASIKGEFYKSNNSTALGMCPMDLSIWTPIGYYASEADNKQYMGTFDGNGKTISGLFLKSSSQDYIGLFGYIGSSGTVKNVTVANSYIIGCNCTGGICGNNAGGTLSSCSNSATVLGINYVGGICGNSFDGAVTNCYNIAFEQQLKSGCLVSEKWNSDAYPVYAGKTQ